MSRKRLRAALRLRARAKLNPNSIPGRLHQSKFDSTAELLQADLPDGNDEQLTAWLVKREEDYPGDFSPILYRDFDIRKLTPSEKLDLAHGIVPTWVKVKRLKLGRDNDE